MIAHYNYNIETANTKGNEMHATYIGFDGATYCANFTQANNKLGGKIEIGVLRITKNGVMRSEQITTKLAAHKYFSEIPQ